MHIFTVFCLGTGAGLGIGLGLALRHRLSGLTPTSAAMPSTERVFGHEGLPREQFLDGLMAALCTFSVRVAARASVSATQNNLLGLHI